MAIIVVNNTNLPIDIKLSSAGIVYHYRNDMPPNVNDGRLDCLHKFNVAWVDWDLSVYYGTPKTRQNPSLNQDFQPIRGKDILADVQTKLTTKEMLEDMIDMIRLLKGSNKFLELPRNSTTALKISQLKLLSKANHAVVRHFTHFKEQHLWMSDTYSGGSDIIYPAQIKGLHGHCDFLIVVQGGFQSDELNNQVEVRSLLPPSMTWNNLTDGTTGNSTPVS